MTQKVNQYCRCTQGRLWLVISDYCVSEALHSCKASFFETRNYFIGGYMFDDHEALFENLRSQWGIVLAAALSEYDREEQN